MANRTTHESREFIDGGYRALRELREAGAMRAIGLGVNEWEICVELLERFASSTASCSRAATRCSSSLRSNSLLPLCEAASRVHHLRRAVQLRNPRRRLACRRERSLQLRAHRRSRSSIAWSQLEALCAEFDVPLRAAALQFPLAHPSVASVVAGCANGAEARDCAAMFSHPIPAAFWHALHDRGLVDADAPVPA